MTDYNFWEYVNGNEAISFQMQSKFFKDVVDIFNLGFEYRNTIDPTPAKNQGEIAMRNYKVAEMCNYVKKFLIPEFTKVVLNHTGLIISKVYVHTSAIQGPVGLFAIDLSFGDYVTAAKTIDRVTGVSKHDLNKDVVEMMQMANNFDTKTGKITNSNYGKNKKIAVKMYFDAIMAYCVNDYLPNKNIVEFNAEELAAIMMHEVGHALSIIERSGDYYFTQRRLLDHLNDASVHSEPKEVIDQLYPVMKSSLEVMLKDKNLDKKHVAFLYKSLNHLKEASDKIKNNEGSIGLAIFSGVFNIIFSLFLAVLCLYISLIHILLVNSLIAMVESARLVSDGKTSDTTTSHLNISFCERMADEYVVMHGGSRYLASGLAKIHNFVKYLSIGYISSSIIRNSVMFNMFFKMITFVTNLPNTVITEHTYEDYYTRLDRMRQNSIIALKDKDVPDWLRRELVSDYDELTKILKNNKSIFDTEAMKSLGYFINVLSLDPAEIIKIIFNGNLKRDYVKLTNMVDEMINNRMYYQSQKLLTLKDD